MLLRSRSLKLIAVTLPIALITIGCRENLTAIEKFGATSVSIQNASTKMIKDIYDSCTRKEFVKIQYADARIRSAPRDNTPRVVTPRFVPPSETDPTYKFPPAKIRDKCKSQKLRSLLMQNTNDTLIVYVENLGRLASSNTVTFDQNLKAIKETIVSLSNEADLVKGEQEDFKKSVTNAIDIATSLLNLIADQQRQEKLKPIIICTNDIVNRHVDGLQKIIKLFYVTGVLKEEELMNLEYIEELYSLHLATLANKPETTNSEVYMSLENDYKQRIEAIEIRQEAAQAYINILEKTALTHQALAKTFRGDMTPTAQQDLCQKEGYLPSGAKPNNSLQPSTLKLTPQQIQKTQQILSDYEVSIQPSLNILNRTFN